MSIYKEDSDPVAIGRQVRTLFLTVIERALLDWKWGYKISGHGGGKKQPTRRFRQTVRRLELSYFYGDDFKQICYYAGVDPADVRKANFMPEDCHGLTTRDLTNIRAAAQEYGLRRASAER